MFSKKKPSGGRSGGCLASPTGIAIAMSSNHKEERLRLRSGLEAAIRDVDYSSAHEAAQNLCSSVYEVIPVDLHDLVHDAVMAGYASALRDLAAGKLDDRVRERSTLLD
ncbi:hypothetical protein [Streptomyces sp. MI02-7b]|uniref:hypothetical protein n=1 Tax=Streptomyces sp. MI02-7b TaxID=462941 RepID=UPI0029B28A8C|nr:hypothetical protein [Streptomyces sp. MI02-7b]MDX3077325.1 hypothetical protein [Streptomyces sp. MI02-7b]